MGVYLLSHSGFRAVVTGGERAVVYVRTLGSRTGRAHVVSCWPGAGEILRVRVRENVHGECRGAPLRVREHVRNYRKGKLRVDS